MTEQFGPIPGFQHPLDSAHFEGAPGETRAFRHLRLPVKAQLPIPRLIGEGVLAYVTGEEEAADGPWYYCDGTQWLPLVSAVAAAVIFTFDYHVDKLYTGTEGAVTPTANSTFTFKRYSTVEAAISDGIATFSRAFSVFVLPGAAYNEAVSIETFSHKIHIYGGGADNTIIGGTAGGMQVGNTDVYLHELSLGGPTIGHCLTQLGATNNMEIHADHVFFKQIMAGDHAGSEFYDCVWEKGFVPQALDSPDTVKIRGGEVISGGIDLSVSTLSKKSWDVECSFAGQSTLKLRSASNSKFAIKFNTGGGQVFDQVFFKDENSAGIELNCRFVPPGNGGAVVRVEAGVQAETVQLRGIFDWSSGLGAATRLIQSDGVALAWHVDIAQDTDGSGNRIEDAGGRTVEGVFRDSKFTLVPTTAEILTTAGSSGNKVDSGVIAGGSVGIEAAGETAPYRVLTAF